MKTVRGGGQSKPRGACNRGGVATQHIVGELDEVKEKKRKKQEQCTTLRRCRGATHAPVVRVIKPRGWSLLI